jgi:hypothetical protein
MLGGWLLFASISATTVGSATSLSVPAARVAATDPVSVSANASETVSSPVVAASHAMTEDSTVAITAWAPAVAATSLPAIAWTSEMSVHGPSVEGCELDSESCAAALGITTAAMQATIAVHVRATWAGAARSPSLTANTSEQTGTWAAWTITPCYVGAYGGTLSLPLPVVSVGLRVVELPAPVISEEILPVVCVGMKIVETIPPVISMAVLPVVAVGMRLKT